MFVQLALKRTIMLSNWIMYKIFYSARIKSEFTASEFIHSLCSFANFPHITWPRITVFGTWGEGGLCICSVLGILLLILNRISIWKKMVENQIISSFWPLISQNMKIWRKIRWVGEYVGSLPFFVISSHSLLTLDT